MKLGTCGYFRVIQIFLQFFYKCKWNMEYLEFIFKQISQIFVIEKKKKRQVVSLIFLTWMRFS